MSAEPLTDEDRIAYWQGAYERMAARNVELSAKLEWQPIETAPRDGAEVLITTAGVGMLVRVGFWDEARDGVWSVWPGRERMIPTHWMPLPTSPNSPDKAIHR